jgi:hypothetical protein
MYKDDKHINVIEVKQGHRLILRKEKKDSKEIQGSWNVLKQNQIEMTFPSGVRFVFSFLPGTERCEQVNQKNGCIVRMPDPDQLVGEWDWKHDGVNRSADLVLNDRRGGNSSGNQTYWYIMADYKVYIGRTGADDKHIFKIVNNYTMELVEPARNPPTLITRVHPMPQR